MLLKLDEAIEAGYIPKEGDLFLHNGRKEVKLVRVYEEKGETTFSNNMTAVYLDDKGRNVYTRPWQLSKDFKLIIEQ